MFKAGSIRKIILKNFITHKHVELEPGAHLNMILGSNGSGKSTIVAGIILGLGGTPKIIGRGQKVSEFVKHSCDQGSITLVLQGDEPDDRIAIKRKIDKRDMTTWYIDGRKTILREVKEVIEKYDIQVDNLCQFLPQDRVADFAKMNKQELLKETLIALCREDLVEQQEHLINDRGRDVVLQNKIAKDDAKYQELQSTNQRMEGMVRSFKKREKFLKELDNINRKKLWLLYLEKREERNRVKADRDAAHKVLSQKQKEAKPLEAAISSEKKKKGSLLRTRDISAQEKQTIKNSIESKIANLQRLKSGIDSIKDEVKTKLNALKDIEEEIKSTEIRMNVATENKLTCEKQVESENNKRETLQKERSAIDQNYRAANGKMHALETTKGKNVLELRALENQVASQERLVANRMSFLEKLDRNAYQGALWLKDHKHLFRGEVFQPMMVEINVMNKQHAMYLEQSIGFQDKIAFLCTDKEDVEALSEHMTRQNLKVNILYCAAGLPRPTPKHSIEQLRRFGFNAYLDTLFNAPEPIMSYLCKNNRLHEIPVAFSNTDFDADQVPSNVYFRGNTKYNIKVSIYTGNRAIGQTTIDSDKTLSFCIDHLKVEMIRGQIAELQRTNETIDEQIQAVQQKIQQLQQCLGTIDEQMQSLRGQRQYLAQLDNKIQNIKAKLATLQRQRADSSQESIEAAARDKSRRMITNILSTLKEINQQLVTLSSKHVEHEIAKHTITQFQARVNRLENNADTVRRELRDAEKLAQKTIDCYQEVTREAKYMLSKARDASGGFAPDDDGFDAYREAYDRLAENLTELETERENIAGRLQCLTNAADEGELEEYVQRCAEIARMAESLQRDRDELAKITNVMGSSEEEWLRPLETLIARIHAGFSQTFQNMGCAGEVRISKGDDEKDYEKYGICVSVSYRNGAPVQELNNVTQSGGERAVATAAYMLAMQGITPVPFRCVDEINQGMDANNERRIFELLVDVTRQDDGSQYFFISPKLVPGLKYDKIINIHFVHNSPTMETRIKL